VLDLDLDVRISGFIRLGAGADRHRLRIGQAPRGGLRTREAAGADLGEDVRVERQAHRPPSEEESLRLLPHSGGGGARDEVRHVHRRDRLADHEVRSPSVSPHPQEAAEPKFHKEVADPGRLLKSLASVLALRLLGRAARETRRAIAEAKRAIKSKDAERIGQADERLKEAAMRLAEAMRRVNAVAAADEERSSDHSDVVAGELEPTTAIRR
jgi:hypothetical protein